VKRRRKPRALRQRRPYGGRPLRRARFTVEDWNRALRAAYSPDEWAKAIAMMDRLGSVFRRRMIKHEARRTHSATFGVMLGPDGAHLIRL
jgi:hypothetical protein